MNESLSLQHVPEATSDLEGDTDLAAECDRFTQYLIDQSPSDRVRKAYVRAHELGVVRPPEGVSPKDRAALSLAERGGWRLQLADVHARFFQKGGYLRRKLVLMLALIETDTEGRRRADRPHGDGPVQLFFRMAWWGIVAAGLLVMSIPMMWFAGRRRLPREGGR